jgi:hypothetical protein
LDEKKESDRSSRSPKNEVKEPDVVQIKEVLDLDLKPKEILTGVIAKINSARSARSNELP